MKIEKMSEAPSWVYERKRGRHTKYPFLKEMQVGDLLTLPVDEMGCKGVHSVRAYMHNCGTRWNKRFVVRLSDDEKNYEIYRQE